VSFDTIQEGVPRLSAIEDILSASLLNQCYFFTQTIKRGRTKRERERERERQTHNERKMNVIGWFFSSSTSASNNANNNNNNSSSTAGAIDMIAIKDITYLPENKEREKEREREREKDRGVGSLLIPPSLPPSPLLCSPFHLKFTQQSKKGERKLIRLSINGQETDIYMRLGLMGEAFFVERVKEIDYEELLALEREKEKEFEREQALEKEREREREMEREKETMKVSEDEIERDRERDPEQKDSMVTLPLTEETLKLVNQ
jgi:hypothetical protein